MWSSMCDNCEYRNKKRRITHGEYIRACNREELVSLIVCELRNTDLHNMQLKYNCDSQFDAVRKWLEDEIEEN